ncbi:hypothetical protein B0H11DRAFT_2416122 [Mycena galericulata]|nr:hypothetical protein B0H11DRAFT_2416122 [Mycena galericulata]
MYSALTPDNPLELRYFVGASGTGVWLHLYMGESAGGGDRAPGKYADWSTGAESRTSTRAEKGVIGETEPSEDETLQDALGDLDAGETGDNGLEGKECMPGKAGSECLRKWRRIFDLTLNSRPHEGWGQRKAGVDVQKANPEVKREKEKITHSSPSPPCSTFPISASPSDNPEDKEGPSWKNASARRGAGDGDLGGMRMGCRACHEMLGEHLMDTREDDRLGIEG